MSTEMGQEERSCDKNQITWRAQTGANAKMKERTSRRHG